MAAPMELPFGLRIPVVQGNDVLLDGVQIPHGKGQFLGVKGVPL